MNGYFNDNAYFRHWIYLWSQAIQNQIQKDLVVIVSEFDKQFHQLYFCVFKSLESFEKLPKKNQHISCELSSNNSADNNCQNSSHSKGQPIQSDNYSYVQLTAVHDYNSYTGIDDNPLAISSLCTDSTGSLKKRQGLDATDSINKDSILIRARLRCR